MIRKIYLIATICFLSLYCSGQTIRISYEPGYGFYSLKNLKSTQKTMAMQVNGLPVKAIVQFPDYITQGASIGCYLDKNNIVGINASYLTTGGRNYLSDYSGVYKLDMILNGYQLGIESEHIFNLDNKFDLNANFKLGVIQSNLDISEYLEIYNVDHTTSSDQITQTNFFLEPNLSLSYPIRNDIAIKFGVGYNLNTSTFNNELIDWSGLRTRIGISWSL